MVLMWGRRKRMCRMSKEFLIGAAARSITGLFMTCLTVLETV
jgi:hypothetical protein